MKKVKDILFIVNSEKTESERIVEKLSSYAKKSGVNVEVSCAFPVDEACFKNKDACCVIGGDGTILACLKPAVKYDIPIFGINVGKLGFLAQFTDISKELFLDLLNGENRIAERVLLEVSLTDGKKKWDIALNDFVIRGKNPLKLSTFSTYIDNEPIANYAADGLIFSTPTGSTAYNLSAGGPLIQPSANVFVMTPICPHTLTNRSVVLNSSSKVSVRCADESVLICDGMDDVYLPKNSEFEIFVSKSRLKFLRLKTHSHFSLLRNKLGWAENPRKVKGSNQL